MKSRRVLASHVCTWQRALNQIRCSIFVDPRHNIQSPTTTRLADRSDCGLALPSEAIAIWSSSSNSLLRIALRETRMIRSLAAALVELGDRGMVEDSLSGRIGAKGMKPVLVVVGADKGGVGKTTISRTLLDYLNSADMATRAFDSESPRGTLYRFFPKQTEIVDVTTAAHQVRIIDTLATSDQKITIIDVRAGLLSPMLQTLTDVGFFDLVRSGEFHFILLHILGPSVASLEEIAEISRFVRGQSYFLVKNFINEASFFDWSQDLSKEYAKSSKSAIEINIPKLNELAYEQAELAGVPFSTFVTNKNARGSNGGYSLVLRGYVRTWMNHIVGEYDRVKLLDHLAARHVKLS
jgi:hypothetical protein